MSNLITLPGLIDPHVHLRDPEQTEKEDFYTGTCAAITGGFTTIFDMPNNKTPIFTETLLEQKVKIAREKIICDVGFFFGSLGDNLEEFKKVRNKVFGIKLYLNQTTGNFFINEEILNSIYNSVPDGIIILIHAEDETLNKVIKIIKKIGKKTHFCHISSKFELEQIIQGKEQGLPITCGVTPHHLFLTEDDIKTLGRFGLMKPSLKTQKDVDFLWKNLDKIDVIESDHAPHTIKEKRGEKALFGVPGLETTFPLMLTAVSKGRLTLERLLELCYENPKKIFLNKSGELDTKIEVDLNQEYEIKNENLFTKCKWSPFNGWGVKGKVIRTFIRGQKVYEDGKILVKPGFGKVLRV